MLIWIQSGSKIALLNRLWYEKRFIKINWLKVLFLEIKMLVQGSDILLEITIFMQVHMNGDHFIFIWLIMMKY